MPQNHQRRAGNPQPPSQPSPPRKPRRPWGVTIFWLFFAVAMFWYSLDNMIQTVEVAIYGVTTTGVVTGESTCRGGGYPTVRFVDQAGQTHDATHTALYCSAHKRLGQSIQIAYVPFAPTVYRTTEEMGGEPWWSLLWGSWGIILAGAAVYGIWRAWRTALNPSAAPRAHMPSPRQRARRFSAP